MPNISTNQRVSGQYNLTCRTNPNHKPNEWCGSCLWDQSEAIKQKSSQPNKNSVPKTMSIKKKKSSSKKTTSAKYSKNSLTLVKKSPRPKSSPIDYYHCLLNYAQSGFTDVEGKQKIHACCKKCKAQAPALNNQRDKELVKLITSYKQVGDSLAKLLKPLQ